MESKDTGRRFLSKTGETEPDVFLPNLQCTAPGKRGRLY